MPYKERPKEVSIYFSALYRSTTRLFCPHCNASMLPKQFENHCLAHHGIDGKTRCVWCLGLKTWPAGEKSKNGKHLSSCFREFMKSHKIPVYPFELDDVFEMDDPVNSSSSSNNNNHNNFGTFPDHTSSSSLYANSPPRPHHPHHSLPEKHFFGIEMTHPDPGATQSLREFLEAPVQPLRQEELPRPPVPFADENLNLAASYVLLFLRGTHDFFHAMIKIQATESFRRAMDEDRGRSRTLLFSCWCNGGPYRNPDHRQHRHAIAVSPKNHDFRENVWSKVKLPPGTRPPKPNYPCKALQKIATPLYLVNAMGYVSQRKSRCNFSFAKKKKTTNKGPLQNHHFYIYKTLPTAYDSKLHLALLWDEGVLQLLYQTKFQNVSVKRLAQGTLTRGDGRRQWTQKIGDFYGLHERGIAIQVARDYVPVTDDDNRVTPHFLRLAEGRKLYFEKLPEPLEDEELWLQRQTEGGNRFYDAVEECTWVPRLRDQKILNFHKPLVDKCARLEIQTEELSRKLEEERASKEELRLRMQDLTDRIIRYKDREIARLEQEIDRLNHYISSRQM